VVIIVFWCNLCCGVTCVVVLVLVWYLWCSISRSVEIGFCDVLFWLDRGFLGRSAIVDC